MSDEVLPYVARFAERTRRRLEEETCTCGHIHTGDCEMCECNEFDPHPRIALGKQERAA